METVTFGTEARRMPTLDTTSATAALSAPVPQVSDWSWMLIWPRALLVVVIVPPARREAKRACFARRRRRHPAPIRPGRGTCRGEAAPTTARRWDYDYDE